MRFVPSILVLALTAKLGLSDFVIANTTSCFGEFLAGKCYTNVQIISDGADFNSSYTCDKLYHAQDHRHIQHNTAGPQETNFTSTSDVCGVGRLYFARNYTSTAVNGTFAIYKGNDDSGDSVGSCSYDGASDYMRRCSQMFGTIFYEGAFYCNTTICGSASSSSSSSSTTTSTLTSSITASSSSEVTTKTSTSSSEVTTKTSTSSSGSSGSTTTTGNPSSATSTTAGTSDTSSAATTSGASGTTTTSAASVG